MKKLLKIIDCSTCIENLLDDFNMHNYRYSISLDISSDSVVKIVRFDDHKLIDFTCNFTSINSSLTSKIIITKNVVFNYDKNF